MNQIDKQNSTLNTLPRLQFKVGYDESNFSCLINLKILLNR